MCQDACLRHAIHALLDLKIDISIRVYFAIQVEMFDHVVREVRKLEPHVFVPFHGGIELEILDIDRYVAGVLGGDGAFLMQLDGEQGDGGRAVITRIDDTVPPHCQACPVQFVLCWSVSHHDTPIRDIQTAVGWDIFIVDEENFIGAFDSSRYDLSEAPQC